MLLTNLRLLGHVFNPVSYFYCYRPDGELAAIVAEVSNTFGERHPYLLTDANRVGEGARHVYEHRKLMHVSPFFGMDQTYRFSFTEPGERVHAGVGIVEGDERPFWAELTGRRRPLTNARGGPGADALSPDVTAGDRPHPLAGGEARDEEGARSTTSRASSPGRGRSTAPEPAATRAARRALEPAAARAALAVHPARAPRGPLGACATRRAGASRCALPDGTVRRGGDPATGPDVAVTVASKNLWRRLATRGRLAWASRTSPATGGRDDLVALLETLAVERRGRQPPPRRGSALTALQRRRPRLPRARRPAAARGATSSTTTTSATTSTRCSSTRRGPTRARSSSGRRCRSRRRSRPSTGASARSSASAGDAHVLEIGCGWGGFALHAAREFGARVTGVDAVARSRPTWPASASRRPACRTASTILLQDYRTHRGALQPHRLDRDARGDRPPRSCRSTSRRLDRLLAPGGVACVQTIAVPDQRYERYRRGRRLDPRATSSPAR